MESMHQLQDMKRTLKIQQTPRNAAKNNSRHARAAHELQQQRRQVHGDAAETQVYQKQTPVYAKEAAANREDGRYPLEQRR